MTALRDGLARAMREKWGSDFTPMIGDVLAILRATIPGFEALVKGEAVVVPNEVRDDAVDMLRVYMCDGIADKLAASPFKPRSP